MSSNTKTHLPNNVFCIKREAEKLCHKNVMFDYKDQFNLYKFIQKDYKALYLEHNLFSIPDTGPP